MSKGIINKLKQFEELCKDSTHLSDAPAELPFYLLTSIGESFFGYGCILGYSFTSPFFIVKSIDPEQQSAVLNLLAPYPLHRGDEEYFCCIKTLLRTDICITVNLTNFTGITNVPIPVSEFLVLTDILAENFCLPFTVRESESSMIIWSNNENPLKNTATITLKYQMGIDLQVKMNLVTTEKVETVIALKGNGRAITVKDLLYIEICPPAKMARGTVQIQLNRKEERKIYLK